MRAVPKRRKQMRASPAIRSRARELRRDLTRAERLLWDRLKGGKLNGRKIRRQHPIGRFVVDFYCAEAGLAVEVDGEVHRQQTEYDTARTDVLEIEGYRVVRFANREIEENLDAVLERITALLPDA